MKVGFSSEAAITIAVRPETFDPFYHTISREKALKDVRAWVKSGTGFKVKYEVLEEHLQIDLDYEHGYRFNSVEEAASWIKAQKITSESLQLEIEVNSYPITVKLITKTETSCSTKSKSGKRIAEQLQKELV